jgi:hypothetical protein
MDMLSVTLWIVLFLLSRQAKQNDNQVFIFARFMLALTIVLVSGVSMMIARENVNLAYLLGSGIGSVVTPFALIASLTYLTDLGLKLSESKKD